MLIWLHRPLYIPIELLIVVAISGVLGAAAHHLF